MPFTAQQLTDGLKYALASQAKKEPIDQISFDHPALDWLMRNKEPTVFSNGTYGEPLHVANGSNYQNYFGADPVTYNERDPSKWTQFPYFNFHDGFWFDEDRLQAANITIEDGADAVPTAAEKSTLLDLGLQSYRALKQGIQDALAIEMYRDGSQSTKACPGFESIIDPTPAVGTVGNIDPATFTYWRNNANLTFAAATVMANMEASWAACIKYGGMRPDYIVCGRAFYDNYLVYAASAVQRHQVVQGKGGVTMDASIEGANFKGIPLVWDPTLEAIDTLLSTSTRTKTAYFANSKAIKFRPVKGAWMIDRKPERLPDRYVYYFARTGKYSLTTNKRNALAVLSIS